MEKDIENFYKEQAESNKDNNLNVVFTMLAKEEENHSKILRANADKLAIPLEDSNILNESLLIFKNMDPVNSNIRETPTQLELYRYALGKEEESVKLYRDLYVKSTTEQAKTVFNYLIKQEEIHCVIIEELVKMVGRPEEWVESPEFGLRETY